MLQQTQVERVVRYWTRWMERFPTVQILADSSLDDVNAVWAGLGYYGRAKRLQEGAKFIVEKNAGKVPQDVEETAIHRLRDFTRKPEDFEELLAVPGIGPYTAGAIASIGFGKRAPIVDGNVVRVFARLQALEGSAASAALQKECWALAADLVDPAEPGSFNQALMELGATVCTPKAPACDRCPVRDHCRAAELEAQGAVSSVAIFPAKADKKQPRLVRLAVAVIEDAQGRVLLVRRPPKGLLAGQWEFPCVTLDNQDGDLGSARKDIADEGSQDPQARLWAFLVKDGFLAFGAKAADQSSAPLARAPMEVEHTFSHQRHIMLLYHWRIGEAGDAGASSPQVAEPEAGQGIRAATWMSPGEAEAAGMTSGVMRVFEALGLSGTASATSSAKRKRRVTSAL